MSVSPTPGMLMLESLKTRPFFKFGAPELDEWHAEHRKGSQPIPVEQQWWDRHGLNTRSAGHYQPYTSYGAYIVDHGDHCTFNEIFIGHVSVAMNDLPQEVAETLRRHHGLSD